MMVSTQRVLLQGALAFLQCLCSGVLRTCRMGDLRPETFAPSIASCVAARSTGLRPIVGSSAVARALPRPSFRHLIPAEVCFTPKRVAASLRCKILGSGALVPCVTGFDSVEIF